MCSDLIDYSSNALSQSEAIKRVAFRYAQWRRLMEKRHSEVLSDSKRKGLIGELLYFKSQIDEGRPYKSTLDGWVGPDGADQDFVYEGLWREVKTTTQSSDKISIHSLEQLGKSDECGELIVYRVDPSAPEAEDAFTLRTLIHHITSLFEGDMSAVEQFMLKLSSVGYIDLDVYDQYSYKFHRVDKYTVDSSFPRLIREKVRQEITECSYTISLPSIEAWKRG